MFENVGVHPHLMMSLMHEDDFYTDETPGNYLFTPNNENIIIEQYTGLKDKNGKEIYEGDIMCFERYPNAKWVIEFNPEKGYKTWHSHPIDDAIVIGNIHETPELLNV